MAVKENLPMLAPDQISDIHRLHWVEKWSVRKIASHLRIGRRTIARYLNVPVPAVTRRERASKLDPFKPAIAELLQQDPERQRPRYRATLAAFGLRRRHHDRQGLSAGRAPEFCCAPCLRAYGASRRRALRHRLGTLRCAGL